MDTGDILGLGVGLIIADAIINKSDNKRRKKKKREREEEPFRW